MVTLYWYNADCNSPNWGLKVSMGAVTSTVLTSTANEVAKKTIASVFDLLAKKYELLDILRFKDHYLELCERNLEIKTLIS